MKIKTSELEGAALDYAVAVATGEVAGGWYSPSTNWSQGGPLVSRRISILVDVFGDWYAEASEGMYGRPLEEFDGQGPTALIAAMRAIVASEIGDTVDIPEELLS